LQSIRPQVYKRRQEHVLR